MESIGYFVLLGLASGAILGILALGLLVVYQGTGVLNFAHTSQAALGAYIYQWLSSEHGVSLGMAFIAAVACAGASGALTHLLVMRPLRGASPLTLLIASTGVLLITQASLLLIFGSDPRNAQSLLPTSPVSLWGDRAIGLDRLLLVAIALAAGTLLWAGYRFTRFGAVMIANAERPVVAQSLGHNPDRVALITWSVGGALAGIGGALLAPISGLGLFLFLSLIMPVLAAGLAGGFFSFPLAVLGGLVIGVVQAQVASATDVRGGTVIATFAILIILMLVRGQAIPSRATIGSRMPSLGSGRIRWQLVVGCLVVFVVGVCFVFSPEWNYAILTSLLIAIPMLSIVVITGYAGQLTFAQFAMAGVGAVIASQMVNWQPGMPFLVLLVLGGVGAVPVGYLLSLVARRMRGASLGVITLGFSVLLYATIFNLTNLVVVPTPKLFGLDFGALLDPRRYILLVLAVFTILALLVANLRRSQSGRRMVAVRGNERAASSIGINVDSTKSTAFMIASCMAGIGGVLIAFRSTAVVYGNFDPLSGISQVAWTVIGGLGWIAGPLAATMFAPGGIGNQVLVSAYNDQFAWLPLFGGVAFVLTVIFNPDGIVDLNVKLLSRLLRITTKPRALSRAVQTNVKARGGREPLNVEDLSVAFGSVRALEHVSLKVEPGVVHGLIGPNGAGKTTLVDAVSGFVRPQSGEISLGEEPLGDLPAWRRARLGIARSFQSLELFDDLDVYDNIRTAAGMRHRRSIFLDLVWPRDPGLTDAAWDAIEMLELSNVLDHNLATLSYGKRRLVGIARALATDADVILLDEPAAGLDEAEAAELRRVITRIAHEGGVGVLLIEHDVDLVMDVSDRVTVLNFGEVIAHGSPQDVRTDPAVLAAYLGRAPADSTGQSAMPAEIDAEAR